MVKGPHTLVTHADHATSFNGSGSPAMATAGMGDLLAGILGGLLASGYPVWDACRLAVLWHGWAADHALQKGGPSVLATDVANHLPATWRTMMTGAGS